MQDRETREPDLLSDHPDVDVHAFLDNLKAPVELINHRVTYYSYILTIVLRSLGVPLDRLEFVTGSSYQYSPEYARDLFRYCAVTSEHDARKAGAEVVKQSTSPPLSGLLYPLLQALDEEYLKVDVQFGGVDQRKIFILAEQTLPSLGYARRSHLMNAMVPGLAGGKMSSSDPNSKIDFLDSPAEVKKKIKSAVAAPGVVEENGLLAFIKAVIMPIASLQTSENGTSKFAADDAPTGTLLSFLRKEEYGGNFHATSYEQVEEAYKKEDLHPGDLKATIVDAINKLLAPVQEEFKNNAKFQEIERLAYPPPPAPEKKKKASKKNPLPEGQRPPRQAGEAQATEKTKPIAAAPDADAGVQAAVKEELEEQKHGDPKIDLRDVKEALPSSS